MPPIHYAMYVEYTITWEDGSTDLVTFRWNATRGRYIARWSDYDTAYSTDDTDTYSRLFSAPAMTITFKYAEDGCPDEFATTGLKAGVYGITAMSLANGAN